MNHEINGRFKKGHKINIGKERIKSRTKGKLTKICPVCNKEFGMDRHVCFVKDRKYCSLECSHQAIKKKGKELPCSNCGKIIYITPKNLRYYEKHYCSKECQKNHYKYLMVGKNNPNFDNKWSEEQKMHLSKIRSIPKEKVEEIYSLWKSNLNDKEISKQLGISTSTIKKYRLLKGYQANGKTNELTLEQERNLDRYGIACYWKTVNNIKTHFGEETEKHFKSKTALCYVLHKKKYTFFTEVLVSGGIVDVYDFTNKNIYELENGLTKAKEDEKFKQLFDEEKMNDFFIFGLQDLPDTFEELIEFFESKID